MPEEVVNMRRDGELVGALGITVQGGGGSSKVSTCRAS